MLSWWLAIEVVGLASAPLAALVFSRLPDRGWTLSKPLGLLALGWLVWFPLSAISALPFTSAWILGTFVLFAVGNLALLRVTAIRQALRDLFTRRLGHVIASEVLFAVAFAAMTWERSFTPAVVDTEKFMDVAFLSSIWRAPHLPPPDPWLSGQPINYYYFGHFLVALIAKALGTVPAVAFNIGVGLIFALTAIVVFGVASNIACVARPSSRASWLPTIAGLVSVAFVLVLGNLNGARIWWEGAVKLAAQAPQLLSNPWAWWLHRDLWVQYDWWSPSRVVPNTINEFPAFSFVLADLHAHVLALPFAALAVALAFNLLLADGPGLHAFGEGRLGLLALVVTSVAVGGLYAINGWDLPTYLGLVLLALAIQQWLAHGREFSSLLLLNFVSAGALVIALSVLLYLPFYRGFTSPSQGIGLVPGADHTQIGDEFAIFGIQIFVVLSFLALRLAPWLGGLVKRTTARYIAPTDTQGAASSSDTALGGRTLLAVGLVLALLTLLTRGFGGWTLLWGLLIVACAAIVALRLVHTDENNGATGETAASTRAELAVWCFAGTAVALIVVCELVFLRDIFGFGAGGQLGVDFRMNTVFKLYYQAWLLLGIACGPMLIWLLTMAWQKLGELEIFPAASRYDESTDLAPASLAVVTQGQATLPTPTPESGYVLFARSAPPDPDIDDLPPTGQGHAGREVRGALRWSSAGGIVVWMALVVVLLAAGAIYPVLAVSARTQNFALATSLDGTAYMATDTENAGDAAAITWLNTHVSGDPIIVEGARYDEYTHFGRISAFTGLPTLMGWGGHEVQWRINWLAQPGRGNVINQRLDAVNQIYTNPDQKAVLALLQQYSARYVYVGQAERELYPQADLHRFATYLRVVYNSDGVTIYQVP